MYKNTQKETQNHAIKYISLYSCGLKALDEYGKNNYNSSVLLKNVIYETQKAKNLKKTDASFRGLGVLFGGGVVIAYFLTNCLYKNSFLPMAMICPRILSCKSPKKKGAFKASLGMSRAYT